MAHAAQLGPGVAHHVALWRLDLDHVRAEPRKVLGGDRADGGLPEIEHADAGQRRFELAHDASGWWESSWLVSIRRLVE